MRLPDEVRKCVVFLGRREIAASGVTKFVPEGTGFLLSYPSPSFENFEMTFLVTAKNVARRLEPDFEIRFNTKAGKADYAEVLGRQWFYHETDKSADVAVMLWAPPKLADCLSVGPNLFLNAEIIQHKGIGTGDEVYVTGLFSPAMGIERNTPIVRAGHLAMCPPEDVPIREWETPTMRAFLIEMRSLGGLSGSPVFVQRSIRVQPIQKTGRMPLAAGAIFLLGVVHGHWNVQHLDLDYVSPPKNDKERDLLNAGVAIVQPGDKLVEIIEQDAVMTLLREAEHEATEKNPHYLDGSSPEGVRPKKAKDLREAISHASILTTSSAQAMVEEAYPAASPNKGPAR